MQIVAALALAGAISAAGALSSSSNPAAFLVSPSPTAVRRPSSPVSAASPVSVATRRLAAPAASAASAQPRRPPPPSRAAQRALQEQARDPRRWRLAVDTVRGMTGAGSPVWPDVRAYNAAILACATGRDLGGATRLLAEMQAEGLGLAPNEYTFGALMNAAANVGDAAAASALLHDMRAHHGLVPNVVVYSAAIKAARAAGDPHRALALYKAMAADGVEPNVICLNTVLSALKVAPADAADPADPAATPLWEEAVGLLAAAHDRGARLEALTYSSAMAACAAAGEHEATIEVFERMRARTSTSESGAPIGDKVTYAAAIQACGASGDWQRAVAYLGEMRRSGGTRLAPDAVAWTAAIDAVARNGP